MPYSSNVHHASPGPDLRVPSGLGKIVLRVILLLLVLSGDIESNPGPVGKILVYKYVNLVVYAEVSSTSYVWVED